MKFETPKSQHLLHHEHRAAANRMSHLMSYSFLFGLMMLPLTSMAFAPSLPYVPRGQRQRIFNRNIGTFGILYDPKRTDEEFVDFPTPSQRTVLKKEASKRQARKSLVTFSLSLEESEGPFSTETLSEVWNLLAQNELVLVRGISKEHKKRIFDTAERLCAELETIQDEFPVTLLSMKGHTALIFSPALSTDHPSHVPLRTSVGQKNTWRARPKPVRDNRGQIIKPKQ